MTLVKFVLHLVKQILPIMKTRFLFPHKWQIPGIVLLAAGLIFCFITNRFNLAIFVWHDFAPTRSGFAGGPDEIFDNEIQLALVLLGLTLCAFSKEKIEDEQIAQLRLDSLQWAVYVNYIVFFLIIFLTYGLGFLMCSMYNVLTLLVFFIIRFRWKTYQTNRLVSLEEKAS